MWTEWYKKHPEQKEDLTLDDISSEVHSLYLEVAEGDPLSEHILWRFEEKKSDSAWFDMRKVSIPAGTGNPLVLDTYCVNFIVNNIEWRYFSIWSWEMILANPNDNNSCYVVIWWNIYKWTNLNYVSISNSLKQEEITQLKIGYWNKEWIDWRNNRALADQKFSEYFDAYLSEQFWLEYLSGESFLWEMGFVDQEQFDHFMNTWEYIEKEADIEEENKTRWVVYDPFKREEVEFKSEEAYRAYIKKLDEQFAQRDERWVEELARDPEEDRHHDGDMVYFEWTDAQESFEEFDRNKVDLFRDNIHDLTQQEAQEQIEELTDTYGVTPVFTYLQYKQWYITEQEFERIYSSFVAICNEFADEWFSYDKTQMTMTTAVMSRIMDFYDEHFEYATGGKIGKTFIGVMNFWTGKVKMDCNIFSMLAMDLSSVWWVENDLRFAKYVPENGSVSHVNLRSADDKMMYDFTPPFLYEDTTSYQLEDWTSAELVASWWIAYGYAIGFNEYQIEGETEKDILDERSSAKLTYDLTPEGATDLFKKHSLERLQWATHKAIQYYYNQHFQKPADRDANKASLQQFTKDVSQYMNSDLMKQYEDYDHLMGLLKTILDDIVSWYDGLLQKSYDQWVESVRTYLADPTISDQDKLNRWKSWSFKTQMYQDYETVYWYPLKDDYLQYGFVDIDTIPDYVHEKFIKPWYEKIDVFLGGIDEEMNTLESQTSQSNAENLITPIPYVWGAE